MHHSRTRLVLVACLSAVGPTTLCRGAALPEPDNVLYGSIHFGTNQVTASHTNVWVEVQKADATLIARYPMGANPSLGDFYSLSVPLQSALASALDVLGDDPLASVTDAPLTIRVMECPNPRDPATVYTRYRTNVVVEGRGSVRRLDFGSAIAPADYDTWAAGYGLAANSRELDPDGDGLPNHGEYVAGTHPNDPDSCLALRLAQHEDAAHVSFVALAPQGSAYLGRTRTYDLEQQSSLDSPWTVVPGYSGILGAGQTVAYPIPSTNHVAFFRARVRLTP